VRTLVTGGAGFIGTHLVRAVCQRGDDVVVLDSLAQQVPGAMAPRRAARGSSAPCVIRSAAMWKTVSMPCASSAT
jgi:nucleoside-diphosphate-sugar epimerase